MSDDEIVRPVRNAGPATMGPVERTLWMEVEAADVEVMRADEDLGVLEEECEDIVKAARRKVAGAEKRLSDAEVEYNTWADFEAEYNTWDEA